MLDKLSNLPERLNKSSVLFLDTETTGLNKITNLPFLLPLGVNDKNYCVEWNPSSRDWLNKNLLLAGVVVGHNLKYDWHMLRNGGVNVNVLYDTDIHDTFVAEALIDEHRFTYGLDDLGLEYFQTPKLGNELYEAIAAVFGGPVNKKQMANVSKFYPHDKNLVVRYALRDIDITRMLYYRQCPEIHRQQLDDVFDLEMRALKALVETERRGAPVNTNKVKEVESRLILKQEEVQRIIMNLVGWSVNPRSPIEMTKAFQKLNLPLTTPKGKSAPSFAKDVLNNISHPFITALTESRSIKTMLDTFIEGSIGKNLYNGRIHTDFNQVRGDDYGTGTGRLSSSGPNLQQIPKRDGELAPLIRGLFAHPDKDWIANDWEQFEYRVFAHYVKDDALTKRYRDDPTTDFHSATAELTGKTRDKAKRINLGLVFGMGEGKLAQEVGLPYEITNYKGKDMLVAGPEAKALFAEYHSRFPKAKEFLSTASQIAKSRGFIKTIMGRRIRFPRGEFVHKAGGLVFQGTSADLMKLKLCEINDYFRNTDTELVLIVHDEFDLCAPPETSKRDADIVKQITEDMPQLRIPILSDAGIGKDWWAACTGGK